MKARASDLSEFLRIQKQGNLSQSLIEIGERRFREARLSSEKAAQEGSKANFFSLFDLERREAVHSKLLANLLDPLASHGQGLLFLKEFTAAARLRGLPDDLFNHAPSQFWVGREFPIASGRRLDIVVTCLAAGFLMVIENKIDHQEGESQLDDYRTWMNTQRQYRNPHLIFLTLLGDKARTLSDSKYVAISYKDHVSNWLKACATLPQVPQRNRDLIAQYVSLIRGLVSGGPMNTYEQSLVDFLKDPENLAFFAELQKIAGNVEAELRRRFWKSVEEKVSQNLENPSDVNIRLLGPVGEPTGIRISYSNQSPADNECFISFEQESELLYSVRVVKDITPDESFESLKRIRSELDGRGFKLQKDWPSKWIGWLYFKGYSLKDLTTLNRLTGDDAFAGAAASVLLELFKELGGDAKQFESDLNKS